MGPPEKHEAGSRGGRCAPTEARSAERSPVIPLGGFTAEALDALRKDKGRTADEAVTDAVRAYLAGVRASEADWRVPAALVQFDPVAPEVTAELGLDPTESTASRPRRTGKRSRPSG
jgi:hypothetical protein